MWILEPFDGFAPFSILGEKTPGWAIELVEAGLKNGNLVEDFNPFCRLETRIAEEAHAAMPSFPAAVLDVAQKPVQGAKHAWTEPASRQQNPQGLGP